MENQVVEQAPREHEMYPKEGMRVVSTYIESNNSKNNDNI